MVNFVDGEHPPLRAIGLNLVAEVDHFGWEMIWTSQSWAISDFDDDFVWHGKILPRPHDGRQMFLLKILNG